MGLYQIKKIAASQTFRPQQLCPPNVCVCVCVPYVQLLQVLLKHRRKQQIWPVYSGRERQEREGEWEKRESRASGRRDLWLVKMELKEKWVRKISSRREHWSRRWCTGCGGQEERQSLEGEECEDWPEISIANSLVLVLFCVTAARVFGLCCSTRTGLLRYVYKVLCSASLCARVCRWVIRAAPAV